MTSKDGCGASLAYLAANGSLYCICLRGRGNDTEKIVTREKRRTGKRDSHLRNVVYRCEATVVDLLLTADLIKLYGLDLFVVVEVCNRWD